MCEICRAIDNCEGDLLDSERIAKLDQLLRDVSDGLKDIIKLSRSIREDNVIDAIYDLEDIAQHWDDHIGAALE